MGRTEIKCFQIKNMETMKSETRKGIVWGIIIDAIVGVVFALLVPMRRQRIASQHRIFWPEENSFD